MTIVIVIFGQVSSRRHALARLTSLLWIERSSRLPDDKARIVEETLAPGATVSVGGGHRQRSAGVMRHGPDALHESAPVWCSTLQRNR